MEQVLKGFLLIVIVVVYQVVDKPEITEPYSWSRPYTVKKTGELYLYALQSF